MKLRKLLPALAAATVLGGCVVYPYDNYGYPSRSYYRDHHGSGYYPGYYNDRRDRWRDDDDRRRRWDRD